jgi:hypothetical protein
VRIDATLAQGVRGVAFHGVRGEVESSRDDLVALAEEGRQVANDALELHFDAVHESVALSVTPFEIIDEPFGSRVFGYEATRFGLSVLRRMTQMRRQRTHHAFFAFDAIAFSAINDVQKALWERSAFDFLRSDIGSKRFVFNCATSHHLI